MLYLPHSSSSLIFTPDAKIPIAHTIERLAPDCPPQSGASLFSTRSPQLIARSPQPYNRQFSTGEAIL